MDERPGLMSLSVPCLFPACLPVPCLPAFLFGPERCSVHNPYSLFRRIWWVGEKWRSQVNPPHSAGSAGVF